MSERIPVKAARCADIAPGKTLAVELEGEDILLCHTKEGFFAVSNLCSHAAAKLSDGKLKGVKLLCPLHGAAFDVRDGCALSRPASKPIQTFETLLEGENILVFLNE